ncbi:hypothetical protein GmHk_01G001690 [Glycine max]|nr:hypothetical protein GmHk_01G001690 [Glycine max]
MLLTRVLEPYRSSSFSFCLSSSLSQTGLRFRDCNHIVEFVSATYRLRLKKSRKGKSPGKGGNRFWKCIVVRLKTPKASSLSQTGLRFRDCNHIVELVFVEFVSATYRLRLKKTTKGKGGGGKRFWKSIVVGFKPPREAIEDCFAEFPVSLRFLHPPYFDFRTLVHSSPFSCINCHFHFPSSARLNASISLMPKPAFSFGKHTDFH